jgi:hypothetical protein
VSKVQKDSYLFSLDKFKDMVESAVVDSDETGSNEGKEEEGDDDDDSLIADKSGSSSSDLLVVDGEHFGGPTRFINHSCHPNLRIFAVSLYRGDYRVYELAFFAIDEIPAGTELTFDYMDHDEDHDGVEKEGKVKCLCGALNCRGWLWI